MTELVPTAKPWMAHAACRHHNPDMWHADGYGAHHETAEAVRICRNECPVIATCLLENLHEREGVWGGYTEAQRDTLRRKKSRQRRRVS